MEDLSSGLGDRCRYPEMVVTGLNPYAAPNQLPCECSRRNLRVYSWHGQRLIVRSRPHFRGPFIIIEISLQVGDSPAVASSNFGNDRIKVDLGVDSESTAAILNTYGFALSRVKYSLSIDGNEIVRDSIEGETWWQTVGSGVLLVFICLPIAGIIIWMSL